MYILRSVHKHMHKSVGLRARRLARARLATWPKSGASCWLPLCPWLSLHVARVGVFVLGPSSSKPAHSCVCTHFGQASWGCDEAALHEVSRCARRFIAHSTLGQRAPAADGRWVSQASDGRHQSGGRQVNGRLSERRAQAQAGGPELRASLAGNNGALALASSDNWIVCCWLAPAE